LVALGLTTSSQLSNSRKTIESLPFIGQTFFKLLPFILLSLAFAVFYQLMPNTRVRWKAALAGGAVSGCLWHLNNMFSVIYISSALTYSKIYGSLGIIPLFLIGLYLSWLILLFGAQVAYAFQHRRTYLQERQAEKVHQRGREFLALRLMTYLGENFHQGRSAPTLTRITDDLAVSAHLACQVLAALVENNLLLEVADGEPGYAPKRPLNKITCEDILQAVRVGRGKDLPTRDEPIRELLMDEFDKIDQPQRELARSITLETLVRRALRLEEVLPV
jgi:membrane protein